MFFTYLVDVSDGEARRPHVLLVEDAEMVRTMVTRALERHGYRVTSVATAVDALAVVDTSRDTFDVLLADVRLPGPSGPDLYRALERRRPGLPVVFMSGYGPPSLAAAGEAVPHAELLPKPFTPRELRSAIQAALDRRKERAKDNGGGP